MFLSRPEPVASRYPGSAAGVLPGAPHYHRARLAARLTPSLANMWRTAAATDLRGLTLRNRDPTLVPATQRDVTRCQDVTSQLWSHVTQCPRC